MHTEPVSPSRRTLLKVGGAATGSFLFGIPAGLRAQGAQSPQGASSAARSEVGVWVSISADDTVGVRVVRSEMGQGTITGLAQMLVEELECDWSRIRIEFPTPGESVRRERPWGPYSTGGSRGIRTSHEAVRKGGAAARSMLTQAAALRWGVAADTCTVAAGVISHPPTGRRLRFGEVAEAASRLAVPKEVKLKDPSQWKVIGQPVRRLDTRDKLTGAQQYTSDLRFPGMLVATVRACPVFGGTLTSFDASDAQKVRGVERVVRVDERAVAVVATHFWPARKALDKLRITWDLGPHAAVSQKDIVARLNAGLDGGDAFVGNAAGDAPGAMGRAAKTVKADYFYPFLNHAPMETMSAVVRWSADRCEAWVPTQDGESSLAAVSRTSGLPITQCEVHKVALGGGFGRKIMNDCLIQAVMIAKQFPGRHVMLVWTREEDMTQGRYHPVMACRLTGGLDETGQLSGLHMRLSGQSILASVIPDVLAKNKGMDPVAFQGLNASGEYQIGYTVPNLLIEHAMRNTHVPPGFWRGVNINQNAVFLECFIDELAQAAQEDPLAFRLRLMHNHPRHRAVLEAVAKGIGWATPAAPGVHRGLAQMKSFGSFVAAACELSIVDGTGVRIHRIVAATDPGYAVNPAQIARQVSGSFVFGLSALFEQECTVRDGRIEQTNFDTYGSMRLAQMPKVETIIIQGGGPEWGGIGEPTIAVAAPAVMNALSRGLGRRLRSVPLKNEGLKLV
jgi:isoquinoline 1-oxidoreductase beta subunit